MNKWIGIVRLTKDAEGTVSSNGTSIARFSGACNRKFKQEGQPDADFFNFVAFGKTAETIMNHCTKGTKLLIDAEIRNNNWEKDGVKHYDTQLVVNSFEFCENKGSKAEAKEEAKEDAPIDAGFIAIPDGVAEELPFV